MTEKTVTNGEAWKRTTIGSSLSSLATGVAALVGFVTYQQMNPPREDPFRGQQGTELRRELEGKIAASELRMSLRFSNVEVAQLAVIHEHGQIWQTLNALPPVGWQRRIESLEFWVIRTDNTYHPPLSGGDP